MGNQILDIVTRRATPDDAAAACALVRASIEHGCVADHKQRPELLQAWLGNKNLQTVLGWFSSASNFAVVAEQVTGGQEDAAERALVGMALLTQAGKLALFYVQPDILRSGVGNALLAAVEAQARTWNIGKLHMHSPTSASGFFERHAYINAGRDKACFGLECDFLWKKLDAVEPPSGKRFCNCNS
jgi:GNAT superfamily N-acetyltransferase